MGTGRATAPSKSQWNPKRKTVPNQPHAYSRRTEAPKTVQIKRAANFAAALNLFVIKSLNFLRIHHNLPEPLALLQILMGAAGFAQREHAIHYWLQSSGEDVPQYFMQFAHGSHIGAHQSQLAREQVLQIYRDVRPRRCPTCDQCAATL